MVTAVLIWPDACSCWRCLPKPWILRCDWMTIHVATPLAVFFFLLLFVLLQCGHSLQALTPDASLVLSSSSLTLTHYVRATSCLTSITNTPLHLPLEFCDFTSRSSKPFYLSVPPLPPPTPFPARRFTPSSRLFHSLSAFQLGFGNKRYYQHYNFTFKS